MANILFFVCIFGGITWCFAVSEVKFTVKKLQDNSVLCEQTQDKPAMATILESEDMKLSINYATTNNYFQCVGKNNPNYVFVKNPEKSSRTSVTSIKATPQISGRECTIYTNKDTEIQPVEEVHINKFIGRFTKLQCYVDVHVRLLKTPQTVLVNNIAIRTERNNYTEEEFDHSAEYHYYNNDIVTVQCLPGTDALKDTDNPSPIEFKYDYVEKLDDMFKEQLVDKRSKLFGFRTKLQARHDNSVMICKYHGINDYTTIKVTFVLQNMPDNVGYITINRLKARPFLDNYGLNSEINYYSFNGENVDIACTGYQHGFRAADKEENCETGGTTLTKSLTTPFTYNCFLCEDKDQIYNIKVTTNELESNLKESKRLNVDLPSDNVLIELFKYDGEERDSWIYYEFAEGDQVELKCKESRDETGNAVMEVIYKFNNNKLETSEQLTLTSEHDHNVFECVLRDKIDPGSSDTHVIHKRIKVLFRKRPLMTTTKTSVPVQIDPNESSQSTVIVIIIVSLAMLVSFFGISIVCYTCVKNKKTRDTQTTISSNRLQSRPLPDVPTQTQPLECYDYVYPSNYEEIELDETRNVNRSQQNTMYYWAHQFSSS